MPKYKYDKRKYLNDVSCKIKKQNREELMIALKVICHKRKNSGLDYSCFNTYFDKPQEDWIHPLDKTNKNI